MTWWASAARIESVLLPERVVVITHAPTCLAISIARRPTPVLAVVKRTKSRVLDLPF